MDDREKEQLLQKYYFNVINSAAYRGSKQLYTVLAKHYPGVFTEQFMVPLIKHIQQPAVIGLHHKVNWLAQWGAMQSLVLYLMTTKK